MIRLLPDVKCFFYLRILICLFILSIFIGCNVKIYSSTEKSVNFAAYRSYAWLARSDSVHNYFYDNPIVETNVKKFVNDELKRRGYVIDVYNPDLLLEYHSTAQNKTYIVNNPVYTNSTYPYRPAYSNSASNLSNGYNSARPYSYSNTPYVSSYNTQQVSYVEGTLLIDIIDRKENRLIWRGWSVGALKDENTLEGELQWDIFRIFKKYPVKEIKK